MLQQMCSLLFWVFEFDCGCRLLWLREFASFGDSVWVFVLFWISANFGFLGGF